MQKEIFEQPTAVADTLEAALARERSRPSSSAPAPEASAERDIGADPRLRHQLPRRPGGALLDRGRSRACPATVGDRERVPLPRVGARPRSAGGGDLAVGRDRRHARGAASTRARSASRTASASATCPSRRWCAPSQLRFLTRAGPEIGVASTKAFTTQLAALLLLTLTLAKLARPADAGAGAQRLDALRSLPAALPQRAAPRAAGHGLGERVRAARARPLPRPRHPLPDRHGRRAQAEGDLVHPRRGLCGRRAEARAARAGRRRTCR